MSNGKLKIVMFGPHLSARSGISNVINNWLDVGLDKKIHFQYISTLTKYENGRYLHKFCEAFIAFFRCVVNINQADIAHIHMSTGASFYRKFILLKITKMKKMKTIIHLHGSTFESFYFNNNKLIKKLIVNCFNSADAVIVLSNSWKKFIKKISSNKKIFIIYNGANLKRFVKKEGEKNKINITFMGRLGQRKGTYDLLQAFVKSTSTIPTNTHLTLGGDGDIKKIKDIISKQKIKRVHVPGWLCGKEKIKAFNECDIYVLPSYNEGLPGSILEAMAVGVPIISTPVGGIPEAVIDNKNGFLIQPGDIEHLANRLTLLCTNNELRQQMGIESKKIMQQKFDIIHIVDKLMQVYGDVINR